MLCIFISLPPFTFNIIKCDSFKVIDCKIDILTLYRQLNKQVFVQTYSTVIK